MPEFLQKIFTTIEKVFLRDHSWHYLRDGFLTTVKVTFFAFLIGLILGIIFAVIRVAYKDLKPTWTNSGGILLNLLNKITGLYITVIRGTPTTIQLLIMFNVILIAIDNLPLVAILTFGLNSAAYMSEIFRSGIQAVSHGQKEAARSLGLSYLQTMKKIVLPQAFKNCLPAFGNEVITLFKETSISGFIGLIDLTRGSNIIVSKTFQAAPPYFAAALIYLIVVFSLERIFNLIERKIYA